MIRPPDVNVPFLAEPWLYYGDNITLDYFAQSLGLNRPQRVVNCAFGSGDMLEWTVSDTFRHGNPPTSIVIR